MQTILGSGGAIGIELSRSLLNYTSEIRQVSRKPKQVNAGDQILSADLTKKDEIFRAVQGSEVVYVTVGFPYRSKVWEQVWLPFMKNVVEACTHHSCKLVFFDNIYAIGSDHIGHITENSPMNPASRKGKVRAAVDQFVLDTMAKGSIQAIIARSPDFFGGTARSTSLLINLVYDNLLKGKKAQWIANPHCVHSMGYVPDLAKGTAMLGNTPEAFGQIWNLPVDPSPIRGHEWITLFAENMKCSNQYTVLPTWLLKTLGWFMPILAELADIAYQYERDYYFDSTKFNRYFSYVPTSNAEAVRQALHQIGASRTTVSNQ